MKRAVGYILVSLLLLLLSTTLVKFLSIREIVPDILLVWIVYIAIREGQIAGMTAGFLLGLIVDLLSGPDGMTGLSALAKTVAGFLAGYFYNENKTLQTLGGYQFIIALGVVSLVHNVIYFLIFLQGTDMGWWRMVLVYGIPTMLYTAAIGLLPMFAIARKYLS
jgi:rod shape-determining protein MreD